MYKFQPAIRARGVYARKKASKVTDYLYIFQIYCVRFLVLIIFTNFVV